MFTYIAGKIKTLAKCFFWTGLIASVIIAVIRIFERHRESLEDYIRDSWSFDYKGLLSSVIDIFFRP